MKTLPKILFDSKVGVAGISETLSAFDKKMLKALPDGCTASPDFNFKKCCDAHDIAYNKGGTERDRLAADIALRICIRKHGHRVLAGIYYRAVRLFGRNHFNYHK